MSTFFISDLHLDTSRENITQRFLRFLEEEAKRAEALYILGDFFEVWVGDDVLTPHDQKVLEKLKRYAEKVPTYFMHGNRDFLIGRALLKHSNITLLTEPTLIELYGKKVLLMHGDTLCRKDVSYQRFRRVVRHPVIKWLYLKLPFFLRQSIAFRIRKRSEEQQRHRREKLLSSSDKLISENIFENKYDVTLEAVHEEMHRYDADVLIHGHTHKPVIEKLSLKDKTGLRIVLGDWGKKSTILEYSADEQPKLKEI